jgi:hypothetical protein
MVMPAPDSIPINSVWCGEHRESGFMEFKTQVINPGGAAAQLYNLFSFSGMVDLKGIYLQFTDVTNVVTVSNVFWELWDGVNNVALTAAQNCSGVTLGARLIKDKIAVNAATLMDSDQVRLLEVAGPANKQFQGAVFSAKQGADNYIRMGVTTDVNTDCEIVCVALWSCRYPASSLAPV